METRLKLKQNQRLSQAQKNANDKAWYKEQADLLDTETSKSGYGYGNGDISEYRRMKVNYDLFNNILDLSDFEYVCQPFGAEAGELPANMVNRDISSGKIKAIMGMEMNSPFTWKVIATNPEATTRREQEEFGKIKNFVVSEALRPIREQIEMEYEQKVRGGNLSEQEQKALQQEISQRLQAETPDYVRRYMEREYQDPAEVLSSQLMEYLIKKCDVKRKFNEAFKHGLLSAKEVMYVGIMNGEPQVWNVNSLRFTSDESSDLQFIQDGEWATCEYKMPVSDVVKFFGDEMSDKEIDDLYEDYHHYKTERLRDSIFSFDEFEDRDDNNIRVLHCVWKSLRKIGFLTYRDPDTGEVEETIVFEGYKLNKKFGDISVKWEWIPEVYETWKIGADMYKKMRPIPGQFKDLDNLYYCPLPYYGVIYDNLNSQKTSLMDRLKVYQYYYNIIMYRLELILASDKGKKILMNINAIPSNSGIDIEKWQYFFESTPFMWFNPDEEGYSDVNTIAKEIDMSLASDISKYIEIAEYLRNQAGRSVGITDSVEGQIGPDEAVSNSRQNLVQNLHILEPYFDLHNHLKKNVLQALLEKAKVAYSKGKPRKLSYVLDDMSRKIIDLDPAILDNSTLGLFVSDSSKARETQDLIRQLSHAAMQAQKIEMSDVITMIRQDDIVEAEETLKVAEQRRREHEKEIQAMADRAKAEEEDKKRMREREKEEHEIELAIVKEKEKRKTEIIKGSLIGASFNPEQDADNDGLNDFIEIARHGLDADIKRSKNELDRDKFEHQKEVDRKKLKLEEKKIKNAKAGVAGNTK